MKSSIRICIPSVVMSIVLAVTIPAAASPPGMEVFDEPTWLDSGMIDNVGDEFAEVYVGSAWVPNVHWIRVHFADYELGEQSYVTLVSAADGDLQRFDARSLPEWYNWSAMFRGDEVDVTLHVAPGESGIFIQIDQTRTPEFSIGGEPVLRSICGANDDRTGAGSSVVGRMTNSGCTGWLVSTGAVLSAGHCGVAAGDLIEFLVPASTSHGNTNPSTAANQFPINAASAVSENSGVGQDWLVFTLNRNSTTGFTAHEFYGFLRMTKTVPANGTQVRVTGYGIDNSPAGTGGAGANCCDPDGTGPSGCGFNCNSASQTLQTHAGGLVSSNTNLLTYSVDTMPANSGSPIIWDATTYTIGIHTAGGCSSGGGSNNGTRFSRAVLESAIANLPGPNSRFVDAFNGGLPANGSVFEPFHTVPGAISVVPDGGTVCIVAGSYPAGFGNTFTAGADGRAMTIVAPSGPVTIGN
jgi:V8-like Glu-specific endopeptidase